MAEVTSSGFHSFSSKKPPSFSNNGFTVPSSSSSSSKHIYDDVFSCPPSRKFKSSEFSAFGDDDFAEIFGSSKSENGVWQSTSSSIPVFNIPDSEHRGRNRGGGVDYLGVFGGFGDDKLELPYGEELFDQMKKKAKTSGSDSVNRSKEQKTEATTSHISRHSENGQRRTRGFSQSFESVKHFEHQTEMTPNEPNGTTYVVHTNPRRQHEIDPLQKTQTSSTHTVKDHIEVSMGHRSKKGKHSKNTSLEFGANEQKREHDASFQKASHLSGSNSAAPSHEVLQNTVAGPSKQVKEVAKVQTNVKDDPVKSTSGSTSLNEAGPSQKTENSGSSLTKDDAEFDIDIGLANKKAEPSRNASLEFKKEEPLMSTASKHGTKEWMDEGDDTFHRSKSNSTAAIPDAQQASTVVELSKVVKDDGKVEFDSKHDPMEVEAVEHADVVADKPNGEHDATLREASGLNGSSQGGTSRDTDQVNSVMDPPKEVKDEVRVDAGPHVGKKQGRHARVTSLDLRDHKPAHQKARFGSSYSFDASDETFAARVKVQPSKVMPSSSLPQFFPVENHCKISENSSCKSSGNYMHQGEAGGSPPSLDEQLDVNSTAAISAAALQRAIEEAEMRIRLAKEFLKREGQGNGKMSFKDTLKMNVGKENNNANEVYEYRQKNVEHHPQVESRMKTSRRLERKSVLEPAQVAPVYGGLKKSSKDEKPVEGIGTKESRQIEDDDKREGGEWEAAKHLNQLISGVKSKLASFMTWQAEPEKKEEPKDAEFVKLKDGEIDQRASSSTVETADGGSKTGFIPEPIKVDENELMKSNDAVQVEDVRKVDEVPANEGPTRTGFSFFTFSNESSWGKTHVEEENRKTEVTGGFEAENRSEEIEEETDEQLHGKSEEANEEGLDDAYMSNNESDVIAGEPCRVTECDRSELTYDEERVNEECGVDKLLDEERVDESVEFSHEDNNHDGGPSEECEYDASEVTYQENRKMGEEFGDDRNDFTCHENERLKDESGDRSGNCNHELGGRMNEECGDDGSDDFTHQENRRSSEDCGNESSEFTHKEDTRLSEEDGVEPSSFIHGENNGGRPGEKVEGDINNFPSEQIDDARMNEECVEEPLSSYHSAEAIVMAVETDDEREEYEEAENAESQLDEASDLVDEIENKEEEIEEIINAREENERDQGLINEAEEVVQQKDELEENKRNQSDSSHSAEETENEVANEECKETENVFPSDTEEGFGMDGSNSEIECTVIPDEENEKTMEINGFSSGPEIDTEFTPLPNEESDNLMETTDAFPDPRNNVENPAATRQADDVVHLDGAESADETLPCENFELDEKSEPDLNCGQTDIDGEASESESEKIPENQTEMLNESAEAVDVGEVAADGSDPVGEKHSSEAGHRRRRWFENGEQLSNADRPGILEGDVANLEEIDQEILEESELAGSVEIHADKLESEAPEEVRIATESGNSVEERDIRANAEAALHKRRRWFVNREEGIPEPRTLFGGVKLSSEMEPEIVNESNLEEAAEVVVNAEKSRQNVEVTPRRKRWFESGDALGPNQQQRGDEDARTRVDINQEFKEIGGDAEKSGRAKDEEDIHSKTDPVNEVHGDVNAVNKRKKDKEKEKERIAVERAIREARERAFAEARERARRDAVEKQPKMEESQSQSQSQRVTDNKPSKTSSSEGPSASEKASMLAKVKAERAAVERATAEARERALQKALSEKASHRSREPAGRHQPERNSSFDPKYHSSSSYTKSSDPSNKGEKPDGADGESAERRKARLERQNRTMERAAKALEEKNKRDLLAQKEQAARNMFADALDVEVKRWSTGKEGNLRALLSTLQYILGSDSGWQPISLTDLVAPTAVRKAYKKATLCVHPDKLQQRGASIQQKYICEKVFDLLKEAWSKFNPDER